ncbi:MAG: antibiotic biosynthesis monooxygenase family protein [Dehalococcoidia bacterium]
MFGTVFHMRPRQGQEQAVEEMFRRWNRERRPKVAGVVSSHLLKSQSHPGEIVGIAVFDSEANYRKNAADPEQDVWYRELRGLLEADPEWNDGEVTSV